MFASFVDKAVKKSIRKKRCELGFYWRRCGGLPTKDAWLRLLEICTDATFPKQTLNKVIRPPPKGTQRVSLELRRVYADILYLNSSPRARFGEGLVLPTMEKNWSSHTKRRVEARESYVRSWGSRSSSTRRWRSRSEKNIVDQDGTGEGMEVHRQNSSSDFMMCIGFIKIVMNFGTYRM